MDSYVNGNLRIPKKIETSRNAKHRNGDMQAWGRGAGEAGIPLFLINMVLAAWIKFEFYVPGAITMTVIVGAALMLLLVMESGWIFSGVHRKLVAPPPFLPLLWISPRPTSFPPPLRSPFSSLPLSLPRPVTLLVFPLSRHSCRPSRLSSTTQAAVLNYRDACFSVLPSSSPLSVCPSYVLPRLPLSFLFLLVLSRLA